MCRYGDKYAHGMTSVLSFFVALCTPFYCAESIGGKPFFPPCSKRGFALAKRGRRFRLVDVSGAGRGGDRRPEWGGSSDAGRTLVPRGRGTAGGRTPAAARQGGEEGTACVTVLPVKKGCPDAGYGVVGGKGLRKPLPPAPRREATKPGCRAEAAIQRKKRKRKMKNGCVLSCWWRFGRFSQSPACVAGERYERKEK